MRNQYKILAEKYNQIHENDARIGFERFLELQLIKFFKNPMDPHLFMNVLSEILYPFK